MKKLWIRMFCVLAAGLLLAGCGNGRPETAVDPATPAIQQPAGGTAPDGGSTETAANSTYGGGTAPDGGSAETAANSTYGGGTAPDSGSAETAANSVYGGGTAPDDADLQERIAS